jgi:citrate lyase gamma subunit
VVQELLEQTQTVQAVEEQVLQLTAQMQLEQLAVQVDSAGAVEVVGRLKRRAEQGFSTFSTRRHYDL